MWQAEKGLWDMEPTQYLERWLWLSLFLEAQSLLSPSGVLLGLALWLWVQWKPHARFRWTVAGVLLFLSWAGLFLLWGQLVGHLLSLRPAVLALDGPDVLFARAWPIWAEATLLFPTIAGLVHLFRPKKREVHMPELAPAQAALPEQPAQTPPWGANARPRCPVKRSRPTSLRMRPPRALHKLLRRKHESGLVLYCLVLLGYRWYVARRVLMRPATCSPLARKPAHALRVWHYLGESSSRRNVNRYSLSKREGERYVG